MAKPFHTIESLVYEGEGLQTTKLEINGVDLLQEAEPFGGLVGLNFGLEATSLPSLELFYGNASPGWRRPVQIIYADGSTWTDSNYYDSLPYQDCEAAPELYEPES